MRRIYLAILVILSATAMQAETIYEAVKPLPFDPAGYFAAEPHVDRLLRENQVRTVIEIGSWAGASTRLFGNRVGPNGKVYAIDHWNGTSGHRGEMTNRRLPYIYHLFLSNIQHFGLGDRIIPIRMSSTEALKALSHIRADLIYIDAARDAETVYKDIINWFPSLTPTGVMCGTEIREPGVSKGVQKAARELGMTIHRDKKGFFWVLCDE